jgi:hypothetical protein
MTSAYALKRLNDALEHMGISDTRFIRLLARRNISTRAASMLGAIAWRASQIDGERPTLDDLAEAMEVPTWTLRRLILRHEIHLRTRTGGDGNQKQTRKSGVTEPERKPGGDMTLTGWQKGTPGGGPAQ